MRNYLLAASCLALLAPGAGLAQGQGEPVMKPAPSESRPPPRPAPYRAPPRPGQFHPPPVAPPGMSGPYRPGSVYPGARPGPVVPGRVEPNRPVVGGVPPVPVEPRYGVLRSAPGVATRVDRPRSGDHRISSENQRHWNWNGRRHHGGPYHYPSGHRYRRWRIGQIVPFIFLQPEYVYDDYADLGFDDPPPGYEWVRYGPDMLLVDLDTGEVVDVEYGVFD